MTGTALVPATERPLGIISPGKIDLAKARAALAARGSSVRLFPGTALNFKKGRWFMGYGKTKRLRVKDGAEYVMNLANTVETWQTFVDGRPRFAPLAYVINGESRGDREDQGQLDQSRWDVDEKTGKPIDPVSAIVVCPIREKGKGELHHISLSSISSRIAFDRLLGDWLDQYEDNAGKLPIVRLCEAEERSIKGSADTYLVPVFEIVGWEKASKVDDAGPGGIQVTSGDDDPPSDDEDEDEAPKRAVKASKRPVDDDEDDAPPAKRGRPTASAKAAVDTEDEDQEEDEYDTRGKKVDHSRGNGRAALIPKKAAVDEDDEDDKPRMVRRSAAAAVGLPEPVKRGRKAAPVEDDEERYGEPQPVRRRRVALN